MPIDDYKFPVQRQMLNESRSFDHYIRDQNQRDLTFVEMRLTIPHFRTYYESKFKIWQSTQPGCLRW